MRPLKATEPARSDHRCGRLRGEPGGRGHVVARAYVDVVFGPQTLHRRQSLMPARRQSGNSQVDISFPRSRSSTTSRRRALRVRPLSSRSWKAAPSTVPFCIVPYTRATRSIVLLATCSPRSRAGRQGVRKSPFLARTSTPGGRRCRRMVTDGGLALPARNACRHSGHRAHPLHHLASARDDCPRGRCLRRLPTAGVTSAPAGPVRLGPCSGGDEARLHGARIQIAGAQAARRAARTCRCPRTSSSDFRARRRPISKPPWR